MKRISLNILIVLLFLLQSCIKEDQFSRCKSGLLLKFRYTLNKQHVNLFDSDVNRVTIYIFDSNGKYVDSFAEQGDKLTNEYVMYIPLIEGKYSVLVYGGDFSTYSVGELDNQTNILNQTLRKGVTDIVDFREELKNMTGEEGYIYPITHPDDLYVGLVTDAVAVSNNDQVTTVDLMKNTKKIKVKISNTDMVGAPLDVYITALNGRYNYENNIDTEHGVFKYTPINSLIQSNYMEVDLKMMRLVLGQSSMLVIKNRETSKILYSENMIDQILMTQKYVSQEDFDREDEFVFEMGLKQDDLDIKFTVFINGWIVNDIYPDI